MIRSMTGYGSADAGGEDGSVTVEIRSVNSRGLKVVVKGPPGSEAWEPAFRELTESRLGRGRVDVMLRLDEGAARGDLRELDVQRVRETIAGLELLRDEFGVPGVADLQLLVQTGGLFRERTTNALPEAALESAKRAASAAIDGLIEMREQEGERLEADVRERLSALAEGIDRSEALAPERLERERDRLKALVEELAERELDEDRLAREIVLIADKWNVSEELVRARSHVAAFHEYLDRPAGEPVGKRLGFLVQELQREINTLGAKANDVRISREVVEMKNEIEKLREQVENVE